MGMLRMRADGLLVVAWIGWRSLEGCLLDEAKNCFEGSLGWMNLGRTCFEHLFSC